jgi:hypothetical protein
MIHDALNKSDTSQTDSSSEKISKTSKKEAWIRRLLFEVRKKFLKISDNGKDRRKKSEKEKKRQPTLKTEGGFDRINLVDCLMSGLAMFGMKCSSLLQFDSRKHEEAIKHNLEVLYQIGKVPCDTYLRERLDEIDPKELRGAFKSIFSIIQRNKKLEEYIYLDEGYIMSIDGTGYFSSHKVRCNNCCIKKHSNGSTTYYHQSFQGAIVHPEKNIVIPFCPESISKEDGKEKNDCESNAVKRFFENLRREHPHLKLVATADNIGANGPYIQAALDNKISYLIIAKPSGNKSLFDFISGMKLERYEFTKEGIQYSFEYVNKVPLNDTYPDLLVNFFQYEETNLQTGEKKQCSWITNIKITINNVFKLMKAGRAKWKIENETFNTLKNQGYCFEHNFGHGNKNLTSVFAMLMILAFFIDQAQELLCTYFQEALKKAGRKIRLWEKMIELFKTYLIMSWEDFYLAISHKYHIRPLVIDTS